MEKTILDLLDEVRAIAQTGLNFTKSPYDQQRYNRLMEVVSQQYSRFIDLPTDEIKKRFGADVGYITPKIGVQCAVFDKEGKILLEKRVDDNLWGLPGGWVDVGDGPEEAVKREIMEETNISVTLLKLLGLYTRLPSHFNQPHASIHVLYIALEWQGEIKKSYESVAVEFHDPQEILDWHQDHHTQALDALKYWKASHNQ